MKILQAHPVDASVRERVLESLAALEQEHRMRVLFACESGSRGWGFASPDSDYDVRFIYVHEVDWYLRVEPGHDVIELPITDELDVSGWELRKALSLMRRSNPALLEWLDSPLVYRQDPTFVTRLKAVANECFCPGKGRWHYLSMAWKNFRGHLEGETVRPKKYLYVLRSLLAARWIDAGRGVPPMVFARLVETMVTNAALLEEINQLLAIKMASGEADEDRRFARIHRFIEQELALARPSVEFKKTTRGNDAALDRLLHDAARNMTAL